MLTESPMETAPRLEMKGIVVEFGATRALDGVSISLRPGEIVGLLGHNGAGKSTLLNVATGAVRATAGEYRIDGELVPERCSPVTIADMGATIVHQEPALAENLSVLDNLYLARQAPTSTKTKRQRAQQALDDVDAIVSLDVPVGHLTLGERQLVDLARGTLGGQVKILFLDEPTAALGHRETHALHELIRRLSAQGTTVVYVSHRLPDILDVCKRVIVLSGGSVVLDSSTSGLSSAELVEALAPGTVRRDVVSGDIGDIVLAARYGESTLTARKGEVVGLFGMAAGDQYKLLESLFGVGEGVEASLEGADYAPSSPRDAIGKGVHFVPPEREVDGLIQGASARDNVLMPWLSRFNAGLWIGLRTGADVYARARAALHVRGPEGEEPIAAFSGGNRQKHLVARWMLVQEPELLLLAQPTQGVDVGAKSDIALAVRELADRGVAVLVASAETDEISLICDRAYTMAGGHSKEIMPSGDFDAELLEALFEIVDAASSAESHPGATSPALTARNESHS